MVRQELSPRAGMVWALHWPFLLGAKLGFRGQVLHRGDLWVSILAAQDVAQKTHNKLCSASAQAQLSDKLRTAAAKSGLVHAELG